MKKQLAFMVDSKKCIGCYTCAMACKNQYHQEVGVEWRNLQTLGPKEYPFTDRAFYSLACNHCEKPICMKVCPVGAYTKREKDGIVVQDPQKCIFCYACIDNCPYHAPKPNIKEYRAEKCSMCHERIDAGRTTACVAGCPTKALSLIELSDLDNKEAVQYPPGFAKHPEINPSTRFIEAAAPEVALAKRDL